MNFLENLGKRVLGSVDKHPRILAGVMVVFMLLFHPVVAVVATLSFIAYAYIANEAKV